MTANKLQCRDIAEPRRSQLGARWLSSGCRAYAMCLLLVGCDHSGDDQKKDGAVSVDSSTGDMRDAAVDPGACDLSNESMVHNAYKDADGDGFGVLGPLTVHGCFESAPEGFSLIAGDCDDEDASKQFDLFVDRDGDGYGDTDHVECVAQHAAGYAVLYGDCDDEDATRSPGATEGWFDGVDQNCDGEDNPNDCIAAPGMDHYATKDVVPLPPQSSIVVERDDSCASADLYFVILGACPLCGGGSITAVIGNRGTVASKLRITTNFAQKQFDTPLQPQQATEPFELLISSPGSQVDISTLDGVTDCNFSNNTATVKVGFTDCSP